MTSSGHGTAPGSTVTHRRGPQAAKRMIAKHCAATGELEPENVDDRQQLHLKLLYDVLANLEGKDDQASSKTNEPAA
jgi:hypothetical protein